MKKLNRKYVSKKCLKVIDNENLTWCEALNSQNDYKYSKL